LGWVGIGSIFDNKVTRAKQGWMPRQKGLKVVQIRFEEKEMGLREIPMTRTLGKVKVHSTYLILGSFRWFGYMGLGVPFGADRTRAVCRK